MSPCLIFSSGTSSTGKTTTMKALCEKIVNSVFFDRDDINEGNLYVAQTTTEELPTFEEYVKRDTVFPDNASYVQTPHGEMIKVSPRNAFYRRHVRDQSYIIQANLAQTNLELGKVVVLDGIVMRQVKDKSLQRILEQPKLSQYPAHLIHFIADEEDCRQRILKRAKVDPYAATRVEFSRAQSKESFHRFVTEEHPMKIKELDSYNYLLVNSSNLSTQECVERCLEYISIHLK